MNPKQGIGFKEECGAGGKPWRLQTNNPGGNATPKVLRDALPFVSTEPIYNVQFFVMVNCGDLACVANSHHTQTLAITMQKLRTISSIKK